MSIPKINILDNLPEQLIVREYDVEDIYNAIAKNGWDWVRGQWFKRGIDPTTGEVTNVGGCALGQAALNLNVIGTSEDFTYTDEFSALFGYNPKLNPWDDTNDRAYSISEELVTTFNIESQLRYFSVPPESRWYTGSASVSHTIIEWNDKVVADEAEAVRTTRYFLETYEEVAQMAYDLLSPYFGEKVKLLTVNKEVGVVNQ